LIGDVVRRVDAAGQAHNIGVGRGAIDVAPRAAFALRDGGIMSDRALSPEQPAERHSVSVGGAGRWLAAALALAVLAGCEHGQVSFNRETGQFDVPIGAGSRETR